MVGDDGEEGEFDGDLPPLIEDDGGKGGGEKGGVGGCLPHSVDDMGKGLMVGEMEERKRKLMGMCPRW